MSDQPAEMTPAQERAWILSRYDSNLVPPGIHHRLQELDRLIAVTPRTNNKDTVKTPPRR
jgi:hypothetical protein